MGQTTTYSLRRSRKILRHATSLYRKKWKNLAPNDLDRVEGLLQRLDDAILSNDRTTAHELAKETEAYLPLIMPKSTWDHIRDIGIAVFVALIVAVVVRQVWFELYEIPSGSMRPTLEEQDRTIVSKTAFGLNLPLTAKHLYFNPDLVKRAGIFIFRPENMDLPDSSHLYFYLFPGKKRYIKRCMGKPGDTLYFYGGKVYGIDEKGNDLIELRESPELKGLDHVPFITFEGRVTSAGPNTRNIHTPVFLHQMDQTLARLTLRGNGEIRGHIFNGKDWQLDQGYSSDPTKITTYGDFWGIKNFAMARLLTPEQAIALGELPTDLIGKGVLYLELRHTPNLHWPKPHLGRDAQGRIRPMLTPSITLIPLSSDYLDRIMDSMYTSRFKVEGEYAYLSRFANQPAKGLYSPRLPGVPNGEYELYHGKAYKISWGGIRTLLPADHPLYSRDPANVQRLFNLGIEMMTGFEPTPHNHVFYPSRYAYYRNGDLYLLGAPVLKKGEKTLDDFVAREERMAKQSSLQAPYIPFLDQGAPMKDGKIDVDFMQTFGLKIPSGMYVALGDNYASSADSRDFGFVPQENLRGAPVMILWPPGPRWGVVKHPGSSILNAPRLIVWGLIAAIVASFLLYRRLRKNRPTFKRRSR